MSPLTPHELIIDLFAGGGGASRNNLQAMGSTLSYGKRYCAEMLLNIVREGADDDAVAGGAEFISSQQAAANTRIPDLRATPAGLRFLSCEPLIGPISTLNLLDGIGWVILGGESGPGARMMDPVVAISIETDCRRRNIPFFFKQVGSNPHPAWGAVTGKGTDPTEWPEKLRQQEFPAP